MDEDKKIEELYNKIGAGYHQSQNTFFDGKEDWTRAQVRKVIGPLEGKVVLDVGCGGGIDVKWYQDNGANAYGVDLSEVMLSLARGTVPHPENISQGSYKKLPFPDNYFDIITGRFSLHYLRDLTPAYMEMARVLKPGGRILQIASHPVFDAVTLLSSQEKNLVVVKLFDNKATVEYPPHKFTDYFSPTFFRHFHLLSIKESESIDAENPNNVPETLFFHAQKIT